MDSRFIGPGENPFSERNPENARRYKELHDAGQARKRQLTEHLRELGVPVKGTPDPTDKPPPIIVRPPGHGARRR